MDIYKPCFDTNNESKAILSSGTLWSNKTRIAINAAAPVAKSQRFFNNKRKEKSYYQS